jgi:CheY-like chemotaxis protein
MADASVNGLAASRKTILIADDEPAMRRLIRDSLSEKSYEIVEAADGRAVIKMIQNASVDLIITDVCMPERDGLETIQAIRRLRVNTKILAVSGAFDGLFLAAARAFGADAALAKPFRPNDLADCVDQLLQAA